MAEHELDLVDVLEAAPAGVIVLSDSDREVVFWNAAVLSILGNPVSAARARAARHGFFRSKSEFAAACCRVAAGQAVHRAKTRLWREDGRAVWADVSIRTISIGQRAATLIWYFDVVQATDDQGATARAPRQDGTEPFAQGRLVSTAAEEVPSGVGRPHDATVPRAAEQSTKAVDAAESGLLAMMSHEIRTPMNGIIATAELLHGTALNEEQERMVALILRSGDDLMRLTDDILDFSKLEAGRVRIEDIPFHLDEVVEGVVALLTPKAAEKALVLRQVRRGTGDCARLGDPLRLRQVLLNLVGNAIKFTHAGSVTVDVEAHDETVEIQVVDTGIGIAADRIGRIFMPYQQADASVARVYGGTGLGLSICNMLVGRMNGTLAVTSTLGRGSCFTVTLRLPRHMTALPRGERKRLMTRGRSWAAGDRARAEANQAMILCAEDNPTSRDVLGCVLDRLGFVYETAEDGWDALRMLDRSRHGLLLADLHMPNLGGLALVRRVRARERREGLSRLPVVVVTADALPLSVRKHEAGEVDGYLTKPVRRDQVEATILAALPVWSGLRAVAGGPVEPEAMTACALDLSGLIDLMGPGRVDLARVLRGFVLATAVLRDRLASALAAGDRAKFTAAAHALKGAAGYAGATAIRDKVAELEAKAKRGAELEGLMADFGALSAMMAVLPRDVEASLAALGRCMNTGR